MGWVVDDRQLWYTATQLDRNLPHRSVAINLLLVARESAVDSTQTLNASLVDTLQSTYPQFQVGVHGVLYEYGHVNTLQRIGDSLHSKWVGRCAGTNPQYVYIVLQAELHMLRCSHLGRYQHLGLLLHLLQPYQSGLAVTLKTTRLGAWLPHSCTEVVATLHSQLLSGSHHLFLSLSRARSCYH